MKDMNEIVNAAETINAADCVSTVSNEIVNYLNKMVYREYCAGTILNKYGVSRVVIFRKDFLELRTLPFSNSIFGEATFTITPFCRYYSDINGGESEEFKPFPVGKLKEIVDEYIPCRAYAMDLIVDEDEKQELNLFGEPYYCSVKWDKHRFHLENNYGDLAVIEKV